MFSIQDKALRKFEDTESDLPRLIAQHQEDERVLRTRLRKAQDSERKFGKCSFSWVGDVKN